MSDSHDDDWKVTGYGEGRSPGAILRRQLRELQDAHSKLKAEVRERERKAYAEGCRAYCDVWCTEAEEEVKAEALRRYKEA
jgi:hypothetical protein